MTSYPPSGWSYDRSWPAEFVRDVLNPAHRWYWQVWGRTYADPSLELREGWFSDYRRGLVLHQQHALPDPPATLAEAFAEHDRQLATIRALGFLLTEGVA